MTQAEIIWQLKRGGETVCWSVNVCVFYVWFTVSVLKKNTDIILLGCDEISTRFFCMQIEEHVIFNYHMTDEALSKYGHDINF